MQAWTVWAAAVGLAVVAAGCAARHGRTVAPSGVNATSWRYEVVAGEGAVELRVDAWLPPGSLADLVVRKSADRFVRDAEVEDDDGWHDMVRRGAAFYAPECASGCHVRYRYLLREAAHALRDVDSAEAWGDVIEASPSVWLLHPMLAPASARYSFRVRVPQGLTFATGNFVAADGSSDTYEAAASDLDIAPYAAFGPMRMRHVQPVAGAIVDVAIAPVAFEAGDDALVAWVARSARTMARFLGCFPLDRVMVLVVPARGNGVRHGETMGDGGASIVVEVSESVDSNALTQDWVLPHEMAHLAVPSVPKRHHWIEEGVAVYVQPIARARSGELTPEEVWREFALGMPRGVPTRVDRGLDDTPDWARTYWGGATFCLLADLDIRRRTGNRLGFEDALRGVLASGGSIAQPWRFERLLDTADASVGTSVFRPMNDEIGREPWTVDLARIFRDLGVLVHDGDVVLTDDAPLAPMRRAITEPLPPDVPEPTACRWATPGRMAQR